MIIPAVKTRRPLIHLLLALMLLVSQQLSFAHLMNHALQSSSESSVSIDKAASGKLLVHQSCQDCLAFVALGSALPPHIARFNDFSASASLPQPSILGWFSAQSASPFLARAPPQI